MKVIKKAINFLIENNSLIYLFLTLVSFVFTKRTSLIEAFLISFLNWNIGFRGLIAFIANSIPPFSSIIAKQYNWPEGTTFQREIASAEGAFGTLGILCNFYTGLFWSATIISVSFCWFFSELGGIIRIYKKSKDPNYKIKTRLHLGMMIDFLLSILLFSCYLIWKKNFNTI